MAGQADTGLTYAQAAERVADEWLRDGRMHLPPDDDSGDDDLAFWAAVDALHGGQLAEALIEFNPMLHPRDRRGKFLETLHMLAKPGIFGGEAHTVEVTGTGHRVERTRKGFTVHHEDGARIDFATAEGAADHVEQRLAKAETERKHVEAKAELEASRKEREASIVQRAQWTEEEHRKAQEEFDREFPADEQGRRYYYRIESPSQSAEVAKQQQESGEIWGRAPRNTLAGVRPTVQAYMGRLPEGVRGVEFATDHPVDRGTGRGRGNWSAGEGKASPGLGSPLRVEGDFAKLKVEITRNTQV